MRLIAAVVMPDDLTVASAASLLRAYADQGYAVVVRRRDPVTLWYVFPIADIRSTIQQGNGMLSEVLALDHSTPIATWQVSRGEPTQADRVVLLLDGDRVVGIEVPASPAATPSADVMDEDEGRAWQGREQIGFRARKGPESEAPFEVVRVFYGTDRLAAADARVEPYYSGERGELAFGSAEVCIPSHRDKGTLPRPAWWRFEFREDPARHVIVARVEPLAKNEFLQSVRAMQGKSTRKHALLFVHGYNVSFADALRRTAQLAYDLRTDDRLEFPGVPLLYSWPSQGQFLKYMTDETNIGWTRPRFEQFLRLVLAETGTEVLHVIAHSMGTRALIDCLSAFDTTTLPPGSAVVDQVVLAAPDFDAGTFRDVAQALSQRARRCTLYASSGDRALSASRELRSDLARAGESGEGLVVVGGIDTIDASEVDTSLLGHGYFGERTVLGDIFYLLDGKIPDERYGLRRKSRANLSYWQFVP